MTAPEPPDPSWLQDLVAATVRAGNRQLSQILRHKHLDRLGYSYDEICEAVDTLVEKRRLCIMEGAEERRRDEDSTSLGYRFEVQLGTSPTAYGASNLSALLDRVLLALVSGTPPTWSGSLYRDWFALVLENSPPRYLSALTEVLSSVFLAEDTRAAAARLVAAGELEAKVGIFPYGEGTRLDIELRHVGTGRSGGRR